MPIEARLRWGSSDWPTQNQQVYIQDGTAYLSHPSERVRMGTVQAIIVDPPERRLVYGNAPDAIGYRTSNEDAHQRLRVDVEVAERAYTPMPVAVSLGFGVTKYLGVPPASTSTWPPVIPKPKPPRTAWQRLMEDDAE